MKNEAATTRREFLAVAALAVPAAVAGTVAQRKADDTSAGTARAPAAGYRETAHVLAYYDTTRL